MRSPTVNRVRWADGKAVENLYPGVMAKSRRYELLNAGMIKAKKLGTTTVFDLDSIDEYIAGLPDYGKAA
jgi:hypothetical protein